MSLGVLQSVGQNVTGWVTVSRTEYHWVSYRVGQNVTGCVTVSRTD